MEQPTPTVTNKSYGSTTTTTSGTPTNTPSLTRNPQSAGGRTVQTTESEPLLGEQWLAYESRTPPPPSPANEDATATTTNEHKPFYTDASTIDAGSDDDPHIGINVFTGNDDTLSYSRDDSTLGGDRYFRTNTTPRGSRLTMDGLLEEEPSLHHWGNIFLFGDNHRNGGRSSHRQVYFLVCFGLSVGIALCAVGALVYVEYWHHYGVDVLPADNATNIKHTTTTAIAGSSGIIPFERISRKSFDAVSKILDVELFHPNLLYRENVKKALQSEGGGSGSTPMEPFFKFGFPTGAFWTNLVLLPVVVNGKKGETSTKTMQQSQHQQNEQQSQPQQQQQQGKRTLISSTNPKNTQVENQYSYPIVAYPYSFQWSSSGKLQVSYSASRRTIKPNSIQDAFAPDISFGSTQDITARHVTTFDSLSVSLRFYHNQDNIHSDRGYWESYIVQGSPYITVKYNGLTPELTALSDFVDIVCPPPMDQLAVKLDGATTSSSSLSFGNNNHNSTKKRRLSSTTSATGTDTSKMLGICDVSDDSTQHQKIITGVQFVLTTKEGLTWLLFASEPITFVFDKGARHTIVSKDLFGGVIRVALVPSAVSSNVGGSVSDDAVDLSYLASSPGVKRLIYHADTYPIRGSVLWDFRSGTRNPLAPVLSKSPEEHRTLYDFSKAKGTSSSTPKDSNIGTITFQFDVAHMTGSQNSKVSLLMLSLPHHAASASSAEEMLLYQKEFDLNYYSIKGKMTPVIGNSWSYEEELTSIAFGDEGVLKPTPSASSATKTSAASGKHQTISELTAVAALDQSIRDLILETVGSDIKLNLPDNNNGAYSFGKQIARLAQLAHVAERVEEENSSITINVKNSTDIGAPARRAYALLQMYLTVWLTGDDGSSGSLVYDASLGGILSKEGMKDPYSDFGNGRYNDHHFHYGYVLYAAAILGRRNPQFISQYGAYIDAIFYDVAHISNLAIKNGKKDDALFPLARHKSWFDGHSFASGLFPFADGKSQESSSEAINCYYGAYLWAKVRWGSSADGSKLVNFARLLLATEITGAKTYWHMVPSDASSSPGKTGLTNSTAANTWQAPHAYTPTFEQNYMVGNLGMTDATCTTWFGNENIYVHLINFMPVTAITSELFDKAYVQEERKSLNDAVSVDNSWKGYVICHKAILEPNKAWIEAQELNSNQLDPGLSKSQVLYWISTREGFSPSTTAKTNNAGNDLSSTSSPKSVSSSTKSSTSSQNVVSSEDSTCESHGSCSALNLSGQCCPTDEGVMLGCCD